MTLASETVAVPVATRGVNEMNESNAVKGTNGVDGTSGLNEIKGVSGTNGVKDINGVKGAVYTASKKVAQISNFAAPTMPNGVPKALAESISTTKAEYRQVGRSGLRVSNPIVGTLGMGDSRWMNWIMEEGEATRLLHAAYSKGVNTWDTANAYSNGMSEATIGRAIKEYNIPRRKLVLMTKVGRIMADPDNSESGDFVAFLDEEVRKSKDYANQYGLSRSAVFTAVDQSLERLQTSYIDVLHVHRYDNSVPPEETMRALHDLVSGGKVRYLAASSMWAFEFATLQFVAEKNGWTPFVAMQNHYNLLYREEEREVIKFCNRTGVGLLPWSPLAEGHLARPPGQQGLSQRSSRESRFGNGRSEADQTIIARVQQVAQRRNWTMSQVALAWLNKRVAAPIVGINSIARLDEVLAIRGQELSAEEETYLEAPYEPKRIQGHS